MNTPTLRKLVTPSFIEANDGVQLFVRDWGHGRPIVFVHSWALNSDMWQYQMVDLCERGFRCIAYDQRGHGQSDQPGEGYTYDALADDLARVLVARDLTDAVLVGHSMGCGVVARYLTTHGSKRVARAALLSPTLPFILQTPDNPDGVPGEYFDALRAEVARDFPKWIADNTPPFFMPETSPAMMEWGAGLMHRASLKAALDCNRAIVETDFRVELAEIDVPVLLIHGTADASAPIGLTAERAASLIPDCAFKIYDGAPHGLFVTHIERLNADLRAFAAG